MGKNNNTNNISKVFQIGSYIQLEIDLLNKTELKNINLIENARKFVL